MREVYEHPLYSLTEAARLLRTPHGTVLKWCKGDSKSPPAVDTIPEGRGKGIHTEVASFVALQELHVLASMKKADPSYKVSLKEIRESRQQIREVLGLEEGTREWKYPLLDSRVMSEEKEIILKLTGGWQTPTGQRVFQMVEKAADRAPVNAEANNSTGSQSTARYGCSTYRHGTIQSERNAANANRWERNRSSE